MIREILSKVRIHPLFWLVLGAGIITGHFYEVVMLFTIVFVHEMGHGFSARFFHWPIEKIELFPFGGVAQTNEHGNHSLFEEAVVILAGPAQHLLLGAVAAVLYHFSLLDTDTYVMFQRHNLTILAFNLLPIWPLDGGRLLRMLCSFAYPFKEAIQKSLLFSALLLFVVTTGTFIFQPFHLNLWCVLAFLWVAHYAEWRQRHYLYVRFLMGRYYDEIKPPLKLHLMAARSEETLGEVLSRFQRGVYHKIIVKNDAGWKMIYEESQLLRAFFEEQKIFSRVGELF